MFICDTCSEEQGIHTDLAARSLERCEWCLCYGMCYCVSHNQIPIVPPSSKREHGDYLIGFELILRPHQVKGSFYKRFESLFFAKEYVVQYNERAGRNYNYWLIEEADA